MSQGKSLVEFLTNPKTRSIGIFSLIILMILICIIVVTSIITGRGLKSPVIDLEEAKHPDTAVKTIAIDSLRNKGNTNTTIYDNHGNVNINEK